MINWDVSVKDYALIRAIANRAFLELYEPHEIEVSVQHTIMDLAATHKNGCPLDLEKLLAAPLVDFGHDLLGIRRHLDRATGRLEGLFAPRCAKHLH